MTHVRRHITAFLVATGISVALFSEAQSQSAFPTPAPVPFELRMGELMNTFIQPRHAKLILAGREGNWALATYTLKELQQSFESIARAIPRWNRMPMGDMIRSLTTPALFNVEEAIRLRDSGKFMDAAKGLTRACNSCHTAVDHGFVVIQIPEASAFPNQNFLPTR